MDPPDGGEQDDRGERGIVGPLVGEDEANALDRDAGVLAVRRMLRRELDRLEAHAGQLPPPGLRQDYGRIQPRCPDLAVWRVGPAPDGEGGPLEKAGPRIEKVALGILEVGARAHEWKSRRREALVPAPAG